jgi:DNA-binding IclR family transcriptional regulator
MLRTDEPEKKTVGGSHGVQAAITVLEVLSAFVGAERLSMLKTLAKRTGMHPAKVHRYLVSLCEMGYVEQDSETSRYKLGPAALRLGFAAINTIESVHVARPLMPKFRQRLGHTVVFAVWNPSGPTITIIESPPGVMMMSAREGTVLPILRSSIGRAFGAWLPKWRVAPFIETELSELKNEPMLGVPTSVDEVNRLFDDIRRRGISRVTGQLSPMSHSFAAPVWDASEQLAGVLCVLGPVGQFDSNWNSPTAKGLRQCADVISHGLGYEGA